LAGDVIGFVLLLAGARPIYITGDTVWYEGVGEVARRFQAGVVLLFAGAANAFPDATIVPLHYEGWAHFSQSGDDLVQSFKALGIGARLRLLEPGVPTPIELG